MTWALFAGLGILRSAIAFGKERGSISHLQSHFMRFVALFVVLTAICFAQTPTAVTSDPPQQSDRKLAARMVELQITVSDAGEYIPESATHHDRARERKLNGIMYIAAGEGRHPTVILLHGFPGNEQNLDLAQSIRRAGWNVLYFHYRGAWGSQGDFSFSNAMHDTVAAIYFLHDPANVKRYSIDLNRIVLIGHSMGGFMAAYGALRGYVVAADKPRGGSVEYLPQGLVLISPWNLAYDVAADKNASPRQLAEERAEWRGYQNALHGFTAESGMNEVRAHADDWDLIDWSRNIVGDYIPTLLLYGKYENDEDEAFTLLRNTFQDEVQKAIDSEENNYRKMVPPNAFTSIILPTDHAYSDQRIALQSAIIEWLDRFKVDSRTATQQ
jgi:uncharacterized protein